MLKEIVKEEKKKGKVSTSVSCNILATIENCNKKIKREDKLCGRQVTIEVLKCKYSHPQLNVHTEN